MDNEKFEQVRSEIKRLFTPAVDFKAPYAQVMLDMATTAVIKAMREPTEKMIEAAFHDYAYREKSKQPWNGKAMYHAMIDAITND